MSDGVLSDLLEESQWLYRGVPAESSEVDSVVAAGEVYPPYPGRTGERWREVHVAGDTSTGYTSWTTDRDIARDAAESMCDAEELPGGIRILRVRIDSLDEVKVYLGREDEAEVLIEGTVEGVYLSEDATAEEEDDD